MTPEERADRAANLWMAAARTQSGTRYDKRVFIANEIRAAIVEEGEACARVAYEAFKRNTRLANENEAAPTTEYIDERTKSEIVALFAHIAHEAYDIAAAIRDRQ